MTQQASPSENSRPGRILHLVLTAGILAYVLVVELCEFLWSPFEGFAADIGILSELRIIFVAMGLADLVLVSFVLWKPRKLSSARSAFLLAYLGLDAIAVYGLALFLIGGSRFDFYGFAAPALSGMIALFSQGERWDSLTAAERQEDHIQPPT